jgi:hypothetical protein
MTPSAAGMGVVLLARLASCAPSVAPMLAPAESSGAVVIEVVDHPVWFEGEHAALLLEPASPDEPTAESIRRMLGAYPSPLVNQLVDRIDLGTELTRTGSDLWYHGFFVCDVEPPVRRMFLSVDRLTTPAKLAGTFHHEMGHAVFCSLSPQERAVWAALRRGHVLQDSAVEQTGTSLSRWTTLRTTEEFARYTSLVVLGRQMLADAACADPIVAGKASFVASVLRARGVRVNTDADVTCAEGM